MTRILPLTMISLAASMLATERLSAAPTVADLTDGSPYYYQEADPNAPVSPGVGGPQGDTDSGILHLPVYHGHFQTNETFRFVNIAEQVLTMIGDGKHGLWRYQDNGTIREYITPTGNPVVVGPRVDLSDPREMAELVADLPPQVIGDNYSHFFETSPVGEPDFAGFKNNSFLPDPATGGAVPFLDLPIFHPRYGGKYDDHPPIDLAGWYCTMSAADYPKARAAMDFAFAQKAAGKVGPLGIRAGLDIVENYPKVLRLESFPDAKIWVNTGTREQVFWQEVDTLRTKAEIYLVERPFFNEAFLFLVVVFDDRDFRGSHSYIRPDGAYFEHLVERRLNRLFNTRIVEQPPFHVIRTIRTGRKIPDGRKKVEGTRLYGVHHPGTLTRQAGTNGSGCPSVGGDFGEDYFGAAWPNNYQEITPLCDGVLIDIKLWANLDSATWRDESKNLANNAGSRNGDGTAVQPGVRVKNYLLDDSDSATPALDGGHFGIVTDPFLIESGFVNRDEFFSSDVGVPFNDGVNKGILHDLFYPFGAQDQVTCNPHVNALTGELVNSCANSPSAH